MSLRHYFVFVLLAVTMAAGGCAGMQPRAIGACWELVRTGFRPIAEERSERFLGKLQEETVRCRGGEKAVNLRKYPWVDWQNYWATGGENSKVSGLGALFRTLPLAPNGRGLRGALLDLEHQRVELIKFNLFDNSGTYEEYVRGGMVDDEKIDGPALKVWDAMRLKKGYREMKKGPDLYEAVGGDGKQICWGELIRIRTLTGICNDIKNPRMGSTSMPFARNVEFRTTFPDLKKNEFVKNRHGDRLGLLKPDPHVISRKLFTREQSHPDKCQEGQGLLHFSPDANCDYKKATFFNVLAAFWIQFMTHDWFSHLEEGHNLEDDNGKPVLIPVGCKTQVASSFEKPPIPKDVDGMREFGCLPDWEGDQIDRTYIDEEKDPPKFACEEVKGAIQEVNCLGRAYKTTENKVTAWWDASQIYGYDERSFKRVKKDPIVPAKLLMEPRGDRAGEGEKQSYLPEFEPCDPISHKSRDPINPAWCGQEATAFPDNWSVGLSFFHNVFAREHNQFVEKFRVMQNEEKTRDADSGLRRPKSQNPKDPIPYKDVTPEELFQIARLVVSAEIAKIHTIEWTPQLLYNEPLHRGMNANWDGLFHSHPWVEAALEKVVVDSFGKSKEVKKANQWYSVFAAGPGIFGLGNIKRPCWFWVPLWVPFCKDGWNLLEPDHINGGINHFGSPFNFPEEFVTVYRLHPMVPDLIEYRELDDRNVIKHKIPVVETFRGKATDWMQRGKKMEGVNIKGGLANWALSMGRQPLGLLTLQNHPQFLQKLQPMPPSRTGTGKLDVAALDIIRDRERGVPRFNEFRRQYGLKSLRSFVDFVDQRLPEDSKERKDQEKLVQRLREVYGKHKCDASKIITTAQVNDGKWITDCLGWPDGTEVDNIEDLDTVVGWLAEPVRPHGFAISETQFQVFILNASRRLFSDRFFTSSFRPEFYTHLGVEWVTNNGPGGKKMEEKKSNAHEVEVSPLKRVLLRTIQELEPELKNVVNVFDPWARDRGDYYSLLWKPRPGAESDPAFQ